MSNCQICGDEIKHEKGMPGKFRVSCVVSNGQKSWTMEPKEICQWCARGLTSGLSLYLDRFDLPLGLKSAIKSAIFVDGLEEEGEEKMTEQRCETCRFWVPKEDDKYRYICRLSGQVKWPPDGKGCLGWKQRGC